jgi:hypothetical protein
VLSVIRPRGEYPALFRPQAIFGRFLQWRWPLPERVSLNRASGPLFRFGSQDAKFTHCSRAFQSRSTAAPRLSNSSIRGADGMFRI